MDWICYATPLSEESGVFDYMEITSDDPLAYPDDEVLNRGSGYLPLERKTTRLMEELFMQVRNGIKVHLPD